MQSHYIELLAIPQADMLTAETMGYILQTVHRALPQYAGRIGIGFPLYAPHHSLGNMLRLYGNENDICHINNHLQTQGLADYAVFRQPEKIPDKHQFACFSRVRLKTPSASDIRRMQKRCQQQGLSPDEIANRIQQWRNKSPNKPPAFAYINSTSTGQRMPLFIAKRDKTEAQTGTFNAYGLSQNSTVPVY